MNTSNKLISWEQPYCHVLTPNLKAKLCDQCFKNRNNADLKRCSGCKVVRYCSSQCQAKAWMIHKDECSALKRIAPKVPTDSVLLFYRLLILYKKGKHTEKQSSVFGERCFQDLMSHIEELKNDFKRMQEFVEVMETLKVYVGEEIQLPSAAALLEIFGKVCINSFTICDQEMQSLGVGIYLGASHLDHRCVPNAVPTFNGISLQISRTDGSSFRDSQTFISYTDQLSKTEERQSELRSRYYFTCRCSLCEDVKQDEEKLATLCPTLNCGGNITKTKDADLRPCPVCEKIDFGEKYASKRQSSMVEMQAVLKDLKTLRKARDFQEILTKSKACLKSSGHLFPSTNVLRCRLEDQAFDACIELGKWEEAVTYGKSTLQCYRKFYDQCHPNLGLQLMKLGKIEMYIKHLCEAVKYLQEAESVLRVSHGTENPLHKELASLLDQSMEEQRVQLEFENQESL